MKKIMLFIAILTMLSMARVSYARELNAKEINAVISILQAFDFDSNKIEQVRAIITPLKIQYKEYKTIMPSASISPNVVPKTIKLPPQPIPPKPCEIYHNCPITAQP